MNVTREDDGSWTITVPADEGVRFRGLFAGDAELCPAGTLDALRKLLDLWDETGAILGAGDEWQIDQRLMTARALLDADDAKATPDA